MLWEEDKLGEEFNFVSESIKGCYVAHFWADWILGCEPLEVKGQDFPDLSFDNEKKIFR
jgi:hypothetical protein